jgi:predicted HD phosphohydrolase
MHTDTTSAQLVHVLGHLLQNCTQNACNAAIAEQAVALRSREIIRRVSTTSAYVRLRKVQVQKLVSVLHRCLCRHSPVHRCRQRRSGCRMATATLKGSGDFIQMYV